MGTKGLRTVSCNQAFTVGEVITSGFRVLMVKNYKSELFPLQEHFFPFYERAPPDLLLTVRPDSTTWVSTGNLKDGTKSFLNLCPMSPFTHADTRANVHAILVLPVT